jgi:tetratricopeptide (TPR) repeat protein
LRFKLETITCLTSFSHKNWFVLILIGFTLIMLHACSSESTAPLNRAFHNTTAHYNSYFIGLERIREIEDAIWKSMKPDYNYILRIYPPLDSTMATTYKAEIEDCIKKASIVIQYHKNSKWVDDSYNLIGQARMYGYDFPNAITTFKYVNTKGEDVDAKHWAIVNLMRTFIENGELANASEASDYLESEILNKNNLKHLYLTRAYYYQVIDDKDNMVRNLVSADPLLSRSERARYYFIIGQVYQDIGFASAAYEYYKKCISSNPKYEIAFYAKLNIAQVTELGDSKDLKKVRKYFKKLVKDEKNIEFQDRIYYEWGKFEMKQGHLEEAIVNFNLSVRNSVSDPRQKGVSYLSLGEIYYDTLKDYPKAEAYYDSAVSVLPKTYEHYVTVKHRQEVLTNFISQINTINLQDSLLTLANMDSSAVINIFITQATAARDAEEQAAEIAQKQQRNQTASIANFDQPTGVGASNWYFSNSSAVGAGRTSFRQVWGSRVLEDHWRRSVKLTVAVNDENVLDSEADEDTEVTKTELSRDQLIMNAVNNKYSQLPLTEEARTKAHEALELAYYNLGKIYYFDLLERENAVTSFRKLHGDYPASEYTAETYYLLYLIYQELEDPVQAKEIDDYMHNNMSNSIYTKLIDNPQYKELSSQANEVLTKEYKSIYELYLNDELDTANRIINVLLELHPDVTFSANLRLLQILIIGKTHSLADYQLALQAYIDKYPDHELNTYAKELLDASSTYLSRLIKLKAAEYFVSSTDEYFFVVLSLSNESGKQNEILLEPLVISGFKSQNLEIGSLVLNDSINMTLVQPFITKAEALLFFDTTKAEQLFDELKKPNFVISKSNFDILYKSKEIEAYMEFFREHF